MKAIIANESFEGRVPGQIIMIVDDEWTHHLLSDGFCLATTLTEEQAAEDPMFLVATHVDAEGEVPEHYTIAIDTEAKAAVQAISDKEAAIAAAMSAIAFGSRIIAYFGVLTDAKDLSVEQIATLNETFGPIMTLLNSGSIGTAKAAIEAITPDGVLITENDITLILGEINNFLGV